MIAKAPIKFQIIVKYGHEDEEKLKKGINESLLKKNRERKKQLNLKEEKADQEENNLETLI